MADGFDSHAVSSSEFFNTKVQTVKMKDEICISENSKKLNVGASETQEFEVTDFVTSQSADESIRKKEESIKGKSFNMEENLVGSKDDGSVRCSLKIEVIDDTAMIDISQVGKSCSVDKKIKGFDGKSGRNRKKKNANHQVEKENGEKMVARKAKGRNMEEAKEKNVPISDGSEEKRVYCRKELETLRFVGMEEQRKMWVEVYCGLGDTVQKEYDGLLDSNTQKRIRLSRRHLGKENTPVISGAYFLLLAACVIWIFFFYVVE